MFFYLLLNWYCESIFTCKSKYYSLVWIENDIGDKNSIEFVNTTKFFFHHIYYHNFTQLTSLHADWGSTSYKDTWANFLYGIPLLFWWSLDMQGGVAHESIWPADRMKKCKQAGCSQRLEWITLLIVIVNCSVWCIFMLSCIEI